jgi:ferredoxin
MIVAEQKPIEEIVSAVKKYKKILIASCGTCVTVCMAGGEKEAAELASLLELLPLSDDTEIRVVNVQRQCDQEFLEKADEDVAWADAVLSMGCGAGVQFMAERYIGKQVIPALNTKFIGVNRDVGYWTEVCQGCGDCVLEKTGGVCPVARCSKSIFNGPCGGSSNGKCEVDPEIDCAWQLIYDRLKALGQLDRLYDTIPPRNWSSSRDGGPRRIRKADVALEVK